MTDTTAQPTPPADPDADVKAAVVAVLAALPGVDSAHVGVAVRGGAVTLSGEVDDHPEKEAAEAAVLRVPGVTAVAEEITLSSPWGWRADADLARVAGHALDADADVPGTVTATVHDGSLVLRGTARRQEQRAAAKRVARAVAGVRDVLDLVHVDPALP